MSRAYTIAALHGESSDSHVVLLYSSIVNCFLSVFTLEELIQLYLEFLISCYNSKHSITVHRLSIQGVPQKCTLCLYYLYLQLKLRYFKSVYFIL